MAKKGRREKQRGNGHGRDGGGARASEVAHPSPREAISRAVLPIPDRPYRGLVPFDAADPAATFPPIEMLRPPAGAPNVLVILLDDVGFGASSAFGGVIRTPTADRLAGGGLRFTRFHTTALCSPTRAALLTGRNHHTVGFGGITEIATAAPGYTCVRPNHCAPIAEILKLNGYSTAHFGKAHEVPSWETSAIGPFDRWPQGWGFEHFFGFVGGETNQWVPALYENTTPVEPHATPEQGYHFMEDMTDRAIGWVQQQKSLGPDKPFFLYFAPGATHAPHHVPKEWADTYAGQFDGGWDALRESILARQKELGVVPANAQLTARPAEIPAWDDVAATLKPVLARQMEVYAGFLEYADHHVGRLIDTLAKMQILDDTLVYYVVGDNGASAEGTPQGTLNEGLLFNGMMGLETPEFLAAHIDDLGTPRSFGHYAVGWAHAMDTPYQWTKQVASHWGGTRNGMIVHWPGGFASKGEIRTQFHHVIDLAPTILDAAGLPEPQAVDGVAQTPMHGVSMRYCFDDAAAAERRETQYFEMLGNRGIYHRGWTAVTKHRTPWDVSTGGRLEDDVWELYDTAEDWTQSRDVAKAHPEKLRDLQTLFLIEAARYNVLPIDVRSMERFDAERAGRPELVKGTSQVLFQGMRRIGEYALINVKNKSHEITAHVDLAETGRDGVILSAGGGFGGFALYLENRILTYCYNCAGIQRWYTRSNTPVPAGEHQLRVELTYDGGGFGKGHSVALFVDGQKVGSGRVERTMANLVSLDEGTDVGLETGSSVQEVRLPNRGKFPGRIRWLRIDTGAPDPDHVVSREELFRVAVARQ